MTPDALTLHACLRVKGKCGYTYLRHQLSDDGIRTVTALNELAADGVAERRTVKLSTGDESTHWHPLR